MASGSLAFDNDSPAAGASVQLTVTVTGYQNNAITLQVSPDPGGGADPQTVTVTFADPNSPTAQVPITAAQAGTTYTYSLYIDGQAAVDDQGNPVQAQLKVQPAPPTTTTAPPTTTTAPPTTTTAPLTTTTAPPTTTTAPLTTTTAPPATTTTAAPGTTTTAAPAPSAGD